MKTYLPKKDDVRELVKGQGDCVASDAITLPGRKVGYMLRESPEVAPGNGARGDSGWRFFAGDESDAYVANVVNFNIFPVNAIANLDPDIIPLLNSPPGSAFRRENGTGPFKRAPFPKPMK
ncbi:MAG TPA: DUF2185 domain-containing protein [Vitreimonas sp.]|nr:DUF2185 domain-containing protein [Vitreimonas sp.]